MVLRHSGNGERHKLGEAALARRWPGLDLPDVLGWDTLSPIHQVPVQAPDLVAFAA